MIDSVKKIKSFLLGTKKRAIISSIVFILLIYVSSKTFSANNNKQQYETASAQKGTLIVSVAESGQVAVANRVAVTSGANGIVNHVYVKSGDTATAGETIADLTLDIAGQQKQAQAWASYLSAKNTLDSANANTNSLQSKMFVANQAFINDKGVFNPSDAQKSDPKYVEENADWLAAEAAYKNQTNVVAQAGVAVNNAWLSYETVSSNIVAPSQGTITDLTIAPGMQIGGGSVTVGGQNGTTLTTIANIKSSGTPSVSVNLSEVDAAKVSTGNKATVTFDALPSKTFTGRVIGINTTGTVSSGVTSYPATIILDSPDDKILPNMSATANIITDIKDNVLLVPTAAVQSNGGQSAVRVVKNGQITSVPVVVGESSDSQTEIVSGLNEGDSVVVGFVPSSNAGSSTGASPFSSSNPFRGLGGAGAFRGGGGGRGQ